MMTDTTAKAIIAGSGPSQISRHPSDTLENYEWLLRLHKEQLSKDEFNPYQSYPLALLRALNPAYQFRFWKSAAPFFSVPNTLRQELRGGALIIQELEGLDDQTLRGVAESSRINCRRLLARSELAPSV